MNQPSFQRHLSKPVFNNLTTRQGTLGARLRSALVYTMKRSQSLTCEIRCNDELHLYEGAAAFAVIKCAGLSTGDKREQKITLGMDNSYLDNPILNTDNGRRSPFQNPTVFGYENAGKMGDSIRTRLTEMRMVARAHERSINPEGIVEGFLVQQCRNDPGNYYPIDRQFAYPGRGEVTGIDLVFLKRSGGLVFAELKVEGDGRNPEAFRRQVSMYRQEIIRSEIHDHVIDSYKHAWKQRLEIFGGPIKDFAVDWEDVRSREPKIVLLLAGYQDICEYRPTDDDCAYPQSSTTERRFLSGIQRSMFRVPGAC